MSEPRTIRVGTRATKFCRTQTESVLARLQSTRPELAFEIVDVTGEGDDHLIEALGAGLFDLHVRGCREIPVELPEDIALVACTERNDPFDVLIARDGMLLEDMPEKAVLGVESSRVGVQIAGFRDDLDIKKTSETVDGLLDQLNKGDLAGFIVAAEDVETLSWENAVSEVFPPDIILPAAGQGSFGFLARTSDAETAAAVASVDHLVTRQVVLAERAFLQELNVRSTDPVAVHGSFEDETLVLEALLGDEVSGAILRDDLDGRPEEEGDLGVRLAKLFMADGARDYLAGYR